MVSRIITFMVKKIILWLVIYYIYGWSLFYFWSVLHLWLIFIVFTMSITFMVVITFMVDTRPINKRFILWTGKEAPV